MPPAKKNTAQHVGDEEPSLADLFNLMKTQGEQLKNQGEQLAAITGKLSAMEQIETEVHSIKTLVVSLKEENKELRTALKEKDEQLDEMQGEVNSLSERLNNLEQHHRGWGARVLNIPMTEGEERDPAVAIQKVYNLALLPVLEGAAKAGKLTSIPSAEQVLEVAHVLPGKPGAPKPIIMRFYNRNLRNLIFSCKKEYAEREPTNSGGGGGRGGGADGQGNGDGSGRRLGRFKYPLYDDLSKPNLAKMRSIAQDERVQACWTVNGQIRFKLKNSETVKKVNSILDPLDKILK